MLSKWKSQNLSDFLDYFKDLWLDGIFNKWQIFHTPSGYAYNRQFKILIIKKLHSVLNYYH